MRRALYYKVSSMYQGIFFVIIWIHLLYPGNNKSNKIVLDFQQRGGKKQSRNNVVTKNLFLSNAHQGHKIKKTKHPPPPKTKILDAF